MRLQEMDRHVTYADQLAGAGAGPVELVNVFTMHPDDAEEFLAVWSDDAAYMRSRPGFVRTRLHRGTGGSAVFVNVATWESAAALRDAFTAPEFQRTLVRYPESVVASPHVTSEVCRM